MCSGILAMKWSNMCDFKWKSGNLVSLSCTVIMSNFHYGYLHSCTYRVFYLLYSLTDFELVGRRYGLLLKLMKRQLGLLVKLLSVLNWKVIRSDRRYFI